MTDFIESFKNQITSEPSIKGRLYEDYVYATFSASESFIILINGASHQLYTSISNLEQDNRQRNKGRRMKRKNRKKKKNGHMQSSKGTQTWRRKDKSSQNLYQTTTQDQRNSSQSKETNEEEGEGIEDSQTSTQEEESHQRVEPSLSSLSISHHEEAGYSASISIHVQNIIRFGDPFADQLQGPPLQYPNWTLYVPDDPKYPVVDGFLRGSIEDIEILICLQITISTPQSHSNKRGDLGRQLLIKNDNDEEDEDNKEGGDIFDRQESRIRPEVTTIEKYASAKREVFFLWITPNQHNQRVLLPGSSEHLSQIGHQQSILYWDDQWKDLF